MMMESKTVTVSLETDAHLLLYHWNPSHSLASKQPPSRNSRTTLTSTCSNKTSRRPQRAGIGTGPRMATGGHCSPHHSSRQSFGRKCSGLAVARGREGG